MTGDESGDEDGDGDPGWPVLESAVEYDVGWFRAGYDRVERPDGAHADYYWVEPGDAVSVVAVTDDREVVLVEQYRPRQGEHVLACPVGGVDDGESYVEAGVRELEEETGFEAGDARLLQTFYDSGWLRRERGVVYATDLEPGDQRLDDGEFIDVNLLDADDALDRAREETPNVWTLVPLLLASRENLL